MDYRFGDRLKEARMYRGLTQKQLAEILGVGTQSIWRWEHNCYTSDYHTHRRIAEVLNVPLDWLMGENSTFSLENTSNFPEKSETASTSMGSVLSNMSFWVTVVDEARKLGASGLESEIKCVSSLLSLALDELHSSQQESDEGINAVLLEE